MDNKHQGGEPVPPTKPQERLVSNKEKYATCTEAASGSGSGALSSSRWSRQETQALLKIRSEMDDAFHGSSMKGNPWEDISRALAGLGYRRSAKRCKEKFEKVHKIYKHTKELHTVRQDQGEPRQESVEAAVSSDCPVLAPSQSMASQSGAVELHHLQPMSLDNISSFFPMSESELESSKGCEEDMMITGEVGSSPALVDKSNRSGSGGGGGGGGGKELTALFDGFMKQVVKRQEEMQQRFLEALEKREAERRAREEAERAAMEEAWRRQEMARLNREHEQLAQERAAIIAFLHRIGQPPPGVISTTPPFPWLLQQELVPAAPLQQQPPQPKHKETTQHDEAWASLNLHPSKSLTDEPSVLNYATPGTVESSTSTQHPIATPDSAQNSTMQQTHDPSTFQNSPSFFTWTSDEYSPGFNSSKFVLETTLRGMYEVIKLAECWVHKDSIANLLQEAKDTVYCAEDLLDELNYYELQDGVGFNANRSSCPEFSDIKMTEIRGKLNHLKEQMGHLGLHDMQPQHFNFESVSQKYYHLMYDETIIGYQEELQVLIDSLILDKNSPTSGQVAEIPDSGRAGQNNLSVLTIVGDGGIGKTALAHYSFNHKKVQEHFDLLVWICVSDGFDDKKLIKRLAWSIAESEMKSDDLSFLQRVLTNGIIHHSRRLLLVLDDLQDDVCQEYYRGWESFLAPLKCARPGSMVLVTTRSMKVAEHISTTRLRLAGLPEETNWHLFSMHAFDLPISDSDQEVECIGRKIASRLNGSPLGAKILGCSSPQEVAEGGYKGQPVACGCSLWQFRRRRPYTFGHIRPESPEMFYLPDWGHSDLHIRKLAWISP